MALESFIVAVLLLFINLIFVIRPLPLLAIPIGIFTVYMVSQVFMSDITLPVQPFFSFFLLMIASICVLANGLSLKER